MYWYWFLNVSSDSYTAAHNFLSCEAVLIVGEYLAVIFLVVIFAVVM